SSSALQFREETRIGLNADAAPANPFFQHMRVAVCEAVRGGKIQKESPSLPGQHLQDDPAVLPFLPLEDGGPPPGREPSDQRSHAQPSLRLDRVRRVLLQEDNPINQSGSTAAMGGVPRRSFPCHPYGSAASAPPVFAVARTQGDSPH